MEELWLLILVLFIATNSLDKAESVKLELKTFDEIFGEGWLEKGEAEDLKTPAPTNFEQNVHHQIDRQNTQIGQNEPNSTDQLGQIEPNSTDQHGQIEPNSTDQLRQIEPKSNSIEQLGQIELNSTDQNAPLTESDHFDKDKNVEENIAEDERKRKIVDKFLAMRNEFKQIGKYSAKEWTQIENEISTHLEVNRKKIYKWKKELGLSQKKQKNKRIILVEKFDKMKAELKRAGLKNSYPNQIDKTAAKELGLNFTTIYKWKKELGQTKQNKYPHNEQKQLMKRYYEIKNQNPKIRDEDIVKMLKIGRVTLYRWKKQFKRQQLLPNSVDEHSVEENAAANVEKIENPNSGII